MLKRRRKIDVLLARTCYPASTRRLPTHTDMLHACHAPSSPIHPFLTWAGPPYHQTCHWICTIVYHITCAISSTRQYLPCLILESLCLHICHVIRAISTLRFWFGTTKSLFYLKRGLICIAHWSKSLTDQIWAIKSNFGDFGGVSNIFYHSRHNCEVGFSKFKLKDWWKW